jgi:hypothetical protein
MTKDKTIPELLKSLGTGTVAGHLGILFVYLKLTNQIDWSWVWVTVPFWGISAAAFLVASVVVLILKAYAWFARGRSTGE